MAVSNSYLDVRQSGSYHIPELPLDIDLETKDVLKAVVAAHRSIAALRREAAKVPNQGILIDTLTLQEAQASSEIESYVTTQDELFQIGPGPSERLGAAQKEVARYRDALHTGQEGFLASQGLLTNNTIISVYQALKRTTGDYRRTPGTTLQNEFTRDVVYIPPQTLLEVKHHMAVLERYINEPDPTGWDPLIKMAVIHHQFESIHPFSDGNGRVGRIVNVMYLVQQGVLDIPILYLSRYITQTKARYYALLQAVREEGVWEEWVLYLTRGVQATADETTLLLRGINNLLVEYKKQIRRDFPKIYSHELLNALFRHPYTRIEHIVSETRVKRQTAARHLDALADAGLLSKQKRGRDNFYINTRLVALFLNRPGMIEEGGV